ncbi:MAG TPA: hypothetical protein VF867_15250 [Arthrobacter sp.]
MTLTPAAEIPRTSSFQNPRVWARILTVLGSVLTLAIIWGIIALDPGFLTAAVRSAGSAQVGTWFALALAAFAGVFFAVRYITETFIGTITNRHTIAAPVLGSAAYVVFSAGLITGHLFEYGCVALLLAMVGRYFIHPEHAAHAAGSEN